MFNKNSKEQANGSSIVGGSVVIDGNFNCAEDIIIFGKVNGSIKTSCDVYIKDTSVVNSDIVAKNIFIDGIVNGNIDCVGSVEVSASAKLVGDVSTGIINIEKGAIFNGKCTIKQQDDSGDVGELKKNIKNNKKEEDTVELLGDENEDIVNDLSLASVEPIRKGRAKTK